MESLPAPWLFLNFLHSWFKYPGTSIQLSKTLNWVLEGLACLCLSYVINFVNNLVFLSLHWLQGNSEEIHNSTLASVLDYCDLPIFVLYFPGFLALSYWYIYGLWLKYLLLSYLCIVSHFKFSLGWSGLWIQIKKQQTNNNINNLKKMLTSLYWSTVICQALYWVLGIKWFLLHLIEVFLTFTLGSFRSQDSNLDSQNLTTRRDFWEPPTLSNNPERGESLTIQDRWSSETLHSNLQLISALLPLLGKLL